jgi:sulfatase modifying factor 1
MSEGAAMLAIPGGDLLMGATTFYPEEAPVKEVSVAPFCIDEAPVTNAQFNHFAASTGYRTSAERDCGSLVFGHYYAARLPGWSYVQGADWRHPAGPGTDWHNLRDHPVVHVSLEDALAFAAWAGKRLPSEAEWEWAARGGLSGLDYAWGPSLRMGDSIPANVWDGEFPYERQGGTDFPLTSAVGAYPANGFGLFDMIGNVWEITASSQSGTDGGCCLAGAEAQAKMLRPIIKGGSHLCAENYCQRYRPAARQFMDEPTSHIGFRCAC